MTQVPAPQALCLSSSLDETLYPPRVRVWPVFSVLPTSSCYKYCSWEVAWSDSAVRLKFIHRSKINGMKKWQIKEKLTLQQPCCIFGQNSVKVCTHEGTSALKSLQKRTSCRDLSRKQFKWSILRNKLQGLMSQKFKLVWNHGTSRRDH